MVAFSAALFALHSTKKKKKKGTAKLISDFLFKAVTIQKAWPQY